MLYDPKWEAPAKVDPLSIDSLIAWLEKQPPKQKYSFHDARNCLIAQYLSAAGEKSCVLYANEVELYFGYVAVERPWTFGAALERARDHQSHK